MQIFLSSKYLIIFWYFHSFSKEIKIKLLPIWIKMLSGLCAILFAGALIEIFIPQIFTSILSIYRDRGVSGFALSSFYGSRILFSEILVILLIIVLCIKNNGFVKITFWKNNMRFVLVFTLLILIIFSFSRKEILFAIFSVFTLMSNKIVKNDRYIYVLLATFIILIGMYGFISYFNEINSVTFSEDYIRYIIAYHALDIFSVYFPFGSGPGTFGSVMSIDYRNVYDAFNVGKAVTGWGSEPGPIFDTFIFSILAEYGIGILFIFYFYYCLFKLQIISHLEKFLDIMNLRRYLLLFCMILTLFTPVLLNIIGFIILTTLALVLDNNYNNKLIIKRSAI